MYRMLIVDDERIIRETISQHIDWASLEVQVIGTSSNGLEAYDMIMDEAPDLVMTDIKMPGFSGLELLKRIKTIHPDIEFILLSGYGEFEYAREAMQWGVHHYLLKPCNEDKIKESVKNVIEEISLRRTTRVPQKSAASKVLDDSIILNLLNECIAQGEGSYNAIYSPYKKYLDFDNIPYELCSLYFLDPDSLKETLDNIYRFREKYASGLPFYAVYVKQCLLIFFQSYHISYENLDTYLTGLQPSSQKIAVEYKRKRYSNLTALMDYVNSHVCRFASIQYSNGGSIISICNYRNVIQEAERLTLAAFRNYDAESDQSLDALCQLVGRISNVTFLKQLISTIIMLASSKCYAFPALEAAEFLVQINKLDTTHEILGRLIAQLHSIYKKNTAAKGQTILLSDRIKEFVEENLSDDSLSLKFIAENHLYMNVDYVSKKFQKETGQKFSAYLTALRVAKAKELLQDADVDKVQAIAELVGFGNNPQYFSQVFKKATGMTPSAYIKYFTGGSKNDQ